MSITNAKQAIRDERKKLVARREEIEGVAQARMIAIDETIASLDKALEALGGTPPPAPGTEPKRTRTYKGRKPFETRLEEVLEILRLHPTEKFTAGTLHEDHEVPAATAAKVIDEIVGRRLVTVTEVLPRGGKEVQYKPTTIRPGEEVKTPGKAQPEPDPEAPPEPASDGPVPPERIPGPPNPPENPEDQPVG